jgi:hypothetical protein
MVNTFIRWSSLAKRGNLVIYGGQTAHSKEEEWNVALELLKCAEWGFIQQSCDVRNWYEVTFVVKILQKFQDSSLGLDWFKSFMGKHMELIEIL